MLMTSRKAQLGLNLVELMIGLVIGMIVLAAMTVVYLNTTRGSKYTLNANRLNQDMRAVMDIMVADIRRAGYWGTADSGNPNPFTVRGGTATDIYVTANCILYSYDATYKAGNVAGTVDDPGDYFGFKLDNGAVSIATNLNNTNQSCGNNLGWQALTDRNVINVSALSFSTGGPSATEQGSMCLNATPSPTVAWMVRHNATTPETTNACSCTATICPATTSPLPVTAGFSTPSNGDRLAETRQITITITANHVADTSLSRTLTETVLARNNRLCTYDTATSTCN